MLGDQQYITPQDAATRCPGPFAWRAVRRAALKDDACRAKLLRHVGDKRPEIAITAAATAAAEKSEAGTQALRRALDSETAAARAIALDALVDRAADGPSFVREFARRADLADADRRAVEVALGRGAAYGPLAADLLKLGTWPDLWTVYQQIAPKECAELALAEAVGDRDGEHRRGAVRVLTEVEDPRRIEVFRKVLNGTDRPAILEVLQAVRDQYLVELGEETLAQLRNPDAGVRGTATEAIDKLKFYAEAKKAFEK
jgi:HEAT repeat protein